MEFGKQEESSIKPGMPAVARLSILRRLEPQDRDVQQAGGAFRAVELVFFFILMPLAYLIRPGELPRIPALIVFGVYCAVLLLRDPAFDRSHLLNAAGLRAGLTSILLRLFPVTALLSGVTFLVKPSDYFDLPVKDTLEWALLLLVYPIISAYPQEFIYRVFFFHRYKIFFPGRRLRIAASAAAFAFMHIVFNNPVAVLLTVFGGFLFAHTYEKTRSLLAVFIEHSLYGCLMFTVGLGEYFFIRF